MISRRRYYNHSHTCPPGWAWLLAGIFIGFFLSFLIYLQEMGTAMPTSSALEKTPVKTESLKKETPKAPHFEFYEILPQSNSSMLAVTTESPKPPIVKTATAPPSPAEISHPQILQVGSFRNAQEAEGLKAHLALLGIKSQVQASALDGTGIWHRVQVGPLHDPAQLARIQAKLRTHHISFLRRQAD